MQEVIGMENANTFMELATPRDWDEVVRVHQLDAAIRSLHDEIKLEFAQMRLEFPTQLERSLRRQTQFIAGFMGSLVIAMFVAVMR